MCVWCVCMCVCMCVWCVCICVCGVCGMCVYVCLVCVYMCVCVCVSNCMWYRNLNSETALAPTCSLSPQKKIWNTVTMLHMTLFSPVSPYFSSLRHKCLPRHPVTEQHSICAFNMTEQVSHSYKVRLMLVGDNILYNFHVTTWSGLMIATF